jgi:hypothetical protein
MVWIAGSTASGSTNQVQFDNIPQTFTHLQFRIFARSTAAATGSTLTVYGFDGTNGATNSALHELYGVGTGGGLSQGITAQYNPGISEIPAANATASIFGACILDVLDYRSTSKMKVLRSFGGNDLNGSGRVNLTGILPMNFGSGTALQNLWFYIPSNYAAGSRFDLYGITSSQVTGA